jgi:hypothetical protein
MVDKGTKRANLIFDLLALFLAHPAEFDCFPAHPQLHALLQPAELASIPAGSVDHAILLTNALVIGWLILGASEEALEFKKD